MFKVDLMSREMTLPRDFQSQAQTWPPSGYTNPPSPFPPFCSCRTSLPRTSLEVICYSTYISFTLCILHFRSDVKTEAVKTSARFSDLKVGIRELSFLFISQQQSKLTMLPLHHNYIMQLLTQQYTLACSWNCWCTHCWVRDICASILLCSTLHLPTLYRICIQASRDCLGKYMQVHLVQHSLREMKQRSATIVHIEMPSYGFSEFICICQMGQHIASDWCNYSKNSPRVWRTKSISTPMRAEGLFLLIASKIHV